jgi:hypothetical protein
MSTPDPITALDLNVLWLSDLKREAGPPMEWLWQGYLARGSITLLTSQWKAGKTTLLSILLDRMKAGGEIAGQTVRPAKAVIVSEESKGMWVERGNRYDLAGHVCWLCRPFPGPPSRADWLTLLDRLLALHADFGLDLVALDPLAYVLPAASENDAASALAALLPLRRLTAAGLAVLLLHHPRKRASAEGQFARGSGSMCGLADVLIEMHCHRPADSLDRRRLLRAWSRHEGTPGRLLMELSPDGRDYVRMSDADDEPPSPHREPLFALLADVPTKATRASILEEWSVDLPRPSPMTLWRLLERAVERGELKRDGAGTQTDPYRYWLPSLEERWKTDPSARAFQDVKDFMRRARLGANPWPPELDEEDDDEIDDDEEADDDDEEEDDDDDEEEDDDEIE